MGNAHGICLMYTHSLNSLGPAECPFRQYQLPLGTGHVCLVCKGNLNKHNSSLVTPAVKKGEEEAWQCELHVARSRNTGEGVGPNYAPANNAPSDGPTYHN